MKKKLSGIITAVALVLVIVIAICISNAFAPKIFDEISYDEYKEEIKNENYYVYVGDKNNVDAMKDFAKTQDIKMLYLDVDKLNDEEHKNIFGSSSSKSALKVSKDGQIYTYDGDFSSYDLMGFLIDNKIILNTVIEVNLDEYIRLINDDSTKVMFIGSATCSYCSMYEPEIESVASKYDNVKVYYIDLSKVTTQEEHAKLLATDTYLSENDWGTPLTILYRNKKHVGEISGYVQEEEVINFLKEYDVIK